MFEITKDLVSLANQALLTEFSYTQTLVFWSTCIFIQSLHQSMQGQFSQLHIKTPLTNDRLMDWSVLGKQSHRFHTVFKGTLNLLMSYNTLVQLSIVRVFFLNNMYYLIFSNNSVRSFHRSAKSCTKSIIHFCKLLAVELKRWTGKGYGHYDLHAT